MKRAGQQRQLNKPLVGIGVVAKVMARAQRLAFTKIGRVGNEPFMH